MPESTRGKIVISNTNFPSSRVLTPDLMGELTARSVAAEAAQDEELCNIPDFVVTGYLRASLDEDEACEFTVNFHEKWEAARIGPKKRQVGIAEATVVVKVYWNELGEVIDVEFKQVGQYGFIFGMGGDEFEVQ